MRRASLLRSLCLIGAGSLLVVGVALTWPARSIADDPADRPFEEVVAPFLDRYCFACHDSEEANGELALDVYRDRAAVVRAPLVWAKVIEKLDTGAMPPDEMPQPGEGEVRAVLSWLRGAVAEGRRLAAADPGRVTVRRLNRAEYNHTVADLLGVHFAPANDFPDDDVGYGFDTIGDVLTLPPLLLEKYLEAAEKISAEAILDFRPVKARVEAEDAEKTSGGAVRDGLSWLNSNGTMTAAVRVPFDGTYVLRARAGGTQAGPEPIRMGFVLGDRSRAFATVPNWHDEEMKVYETRLPLRAGTQRVGVSFTNDFYRPDDPNPKNRDRNFACDWFELEGPLERPALPEAHRRWVTRRPQGDDPAERQAAAREVLAPLATRAFRRPVRPAELERLVSFVEMAAGEGESFERGLQLALQSILISPHFLFRIELDPAPTDANAIHPISELELASRLSYFLWASCPDEELLDLAMAGTLRASLDAQVARLLDDPRSTRFVQSFAGQWLQIRRLSEAQPDPDAFPGFDEDLREAMRIETEMFFESVMREDRSVLDLIDARYTFMNERLARHYGRLGIAGERFRRVTVPPQRGGVLGHASVLTVTSETTRTSPVRRGKWILETLLDAPPPPPLPGMDNLPEGEAVKGKTLRERFAMHRSDPACAACHDRIDPLGFSLEHFDGVGRWRETEGGKPVDATGVLPGGERFEGLSGLQGHLRANDRQFVRGLAKKMLIYALGRGPLPGDDHVLEGLVLRVAPRYRFGDLVRELVRLDAFQKRRGEGTFTAAPPAPETENENENENEPAPAPEKPRRRAF